MKTVIQKLTDKGFNGADIHFFLQRFDIGIWILEPYFPPLLFVSSDEELFKQQEKIKKDDEEHKQKQIDKHLAKWEEANIAADYEKHK